MPHLPVENRWKTALRLSSPVAMGYIPAGIAFGVLFVAAGLPAWAGLLSSVILFAGAAQYASIPLLASGVGIGTLASNTFAINLRHAFYGIPLLQQLPSHPLARFYCLSVLTDETFSVLTTLDEKVRAPLILPISLFNQMYWIIGTVIGMLVGAGLSEVIPHLDFALVCLFAILAYEQFKVIGQFYPIVIAVISFIIAMLLLQNWLLLSAIALSLLMIIAHYMRFGQD